MVKERFAEIELFEQDGKTYVLASELVARREFLLRDIEKSFAGVD